MNILGQAIGFQPTKLSRLQEEGFKSNREVIIALNERREILKRIDETILSNAKDKSEVRKAFLRLKNYNKRYPIEGLYIDSDTVDTSIDTALNKKENVFKGQYMKEDLIPYLMPLRKAATSQ
jgi:hypothetical protein